MIMCEKVRQNKPCLDIYLRKVAIWKSCKDTYFVAWASSNTCWKMKESFSKKNPKKEGRV